MLEGNPDVVCKLPRVLKDQVGASVGLQRKNPKLGIIDSAQCLQTNISRIIIHSSEWCMDW